MTTFIRRLELVNEHDQVLLRLKNKPAKEGIKEALKIMEHKDNGNMTSLLKKWDKEMKEYFEM